MGVSWLITPNLSNFKRVLHSLAATQEVPRHTRLHSRGSSRVRPSSLGAPFLLPSSRGGILSLRGRERIPGVPVASEEEALSTGKARGTPGHATIPRFPQMSQSIPGKPVSLDCLDLKPRIDSHHGGTWDSPAGKPRGKASWESLEGMPQIPCSTRSEV